MVLSVYSRSGMEISLLWEMPKSQYLFLSWIKFNKLEIFHRMGNFENCLVNEIFPVQSLQPETAIPSASMLSSGSCSIAEWWIPFIQAFLPHGNCSSATHRYVTCMLWSMVYSSCVVLHNGRAQLGREHEGIRPWSLSSHESVQLCRKMAFSVSQIQNKSFWVSLTRRYHFSFTSSTNQFCFPVENFSFAEIAFSVIKLLCWKIYNGFIRVLNFSTCFMYLLQ